ncbi:MAG: hypothetical protein ACJA1N_001635 [Saprospiraceae bacterium]|jgi:hypothetical protein
MKILVSIFLIINLFSHSDKFESSEIEKNTITKSIFFNEIDTISLLDTLNFSRYTNQNIADLISESFFPKYQQFWIDEPPGVLRGLSLSFENGYSIDIYINSSKHQERFSEGRSWSFDLFQQEKIKWIDLYKNDRFIKTFQ